MRFKKKQWKRNQMERALWRYFVTYKNWGADFDHLINKVPKVFQSRIKKMLNLDRGIGPTSKIEMPEDQWVFYDEAGSGTGSEEEFSTVHIFMMGLAMDFLNMGLKQSEIIFFLKHTRPVLEKQFKQIHQRPNAKSPITQVARQHHRAKDYPDMPSVKIKRGNNTFSQADFTVWMLVRRIEYKEIYPTLKGKLNIQTPLFLEPEFFVGLEAVKKKIFERPIDYRSLVLIELADLALTIPSHLEETPRIGKGRPKAKSLTPSKTA